MNLKDYAKSFEWGGLCFWIMPYRTLQTDIVIGELNTIEPQFVYVNATTGERVFEKPEELTRFEDKLKKFPDKRLRSPWTAENLWNSSHRTFIFCDSITVAIDAIGTTTPEQENLLHYWQTRSSVIAERWSVFKAILGTESYNAWWSAYTATRDNPAPAPAEMGQPEPDDPLAEKDAHGMPVVNAISVS